MNLDDFLILKNHFLTLENEFVILKISPFYNNRSSSNIKILFSNIQNISFIEINSSVQKIFSKITFNIRISFLILFFKYKKIG